MLLALFTLIAVTLGGLTAIALAQPRGAEVVVWNDDIERRMLRDAKAPLGWW